MQLYPAIKAHMGDWTYYIVKMRMREVAAEVKFGSEVHEDYTLDQAIQRSIKEGRVKKELVAFLTGRSDRFFSSLVVAAVGGTPKFYPVSIADDPQFEIVADEPTIEESFGVLRFSGAQTYYALDGQHRLKAIKTLLQPDDESERIEPPANFENEEISVLMVIRPPESAEEDWLMSYRRLFSSLNRYAKPTDADTNIIMDEDDIFAILTRRLIASHDFFKAPGKHLDSLRVQTRGAALKEGTSFFTTLRQLYAMNEQLLATPAREAQGWGPGPVAERVDDPKRFKRFRPPEDYIDAMADELNVYWNALVAIIPDLGLDPAAAKNHQSAGLDREVADNALFWPIGQEVMISAARALLNQRLETPESPTREQAEAALSPLAKVKWNLHDAPWRGLLLVPATSKRKWSMRSESRKPAVETAKRLLRWLIGYYQLEAKEEETLRKEWEGLLILPPNEDREGLWDQIRAVRERVLG